jgi:hypothetical protein
MQKKMAHKKQFSRKSTGGYAPEYVKKLKAAREVVKYTWVYVMVRFLDIRCRMKVNYESYLSADDILDQCKSPNEIYRVFGVENETNANLHVVVGLQARRYQHDRLDAYILVGLRVREGQDTLIYANNVMVQNLNNHFIHEGCTTTLEPEHINIIYDDNYEFVELCESIIKDMEDNECIGYTDDIVY